MEKIANSALDLVGNTPLVELSRLGRKAGAVARVVAKVELFNPAGSVKDRIALRQKNKYAERERQGRLSRSLVNRYQIKLSAKKTFPPVLRRDAIRRKFSLTSLPKRPSFFIKRASACPLFTISSAAQSPGLL